MSYANNKNKTSQGSRGARGARGGRGRGRGRGRGGRGGNRRNRNYKKQKPQCAPKYEGPIVGTKAYHALHNPDNSYSFDEASTVSKEFMPMAFRYSDNDDNYVMSLQQEMMDNGWQLNCDEDDNKHFTHPTYNRETFTAYSKVLSNGKRVYLPLVPRDEDPKGLGCTFVLSPGSGHGRLETNRWHSYWDDRKGQRRARYLDYLDRRQEKRRTIMEMAKTDSSVKVWYKDTPRCDPKMWGYETNVPSVPSDELVW